METAAALLLLVSLLFLLLLPSAVVLSLEYGRGGFRLDVSALGGLVRLAVAPRGEAAAEPVEELRRFRLALGAFRRFSRPVLYLLHKTRLSRLDLDLAVGLGRADSTAWSAGGLWALGGSMAALASRLAAPGSARPRIRVAPCFGQRRFALEVRGRARVRVWHLLAAGLKAWPAWRRTRDPGRRLHNFSLPGHIKPCRKQPVSAKKTR